tara:strand:- start:216 stop:404 length:189 start_codon:yes stop_codon:yes gene_type:complete
MKGIDEMGVLKRKLLEQMQLKAQQKASLSDAYMRNEIDTMEYSRQMSALDLGEITLKELLNQ